MFYFFIIYDIIFSALVLLYFPVYIARKRINLRAYLEKFSFIGGPKDINESSIWIQAVSIGEVLAIRKLVTELRASRCCQRIVISTTTLTGYSVATRMYGTSAEVIFFPFDLSFALRRFIEKIKPLVFVAIETELWPNLFYQLKRKAVPIVILNGRISNKAYRQYKKFKFFTKKILSMCAYIGVQNDFYRARFLSLGAVSQRTALNDNIKFDSLDAEPSKIAAFHKLYSKYLKPVNSRLLIAASTHYPEERIIIDIYKDLVGTFNLRILIAPRHPFRVKELAKEIISSGLQPVMISKLKETYSKFSLEQDLKNSGVVDESDKKVVFILDTVGELFYFYSLGDICFVGGSLVNYGGHNILEPMYFAKPTLFGPYMSNFLDIEETAIWHQAAIRVKDKQDLKNNIINLLNNGQLCRKLSKNCLRIFSQQYNILKNNVDVVLRFARG